MKKISGISVLVSTIIVAGLCGCASNSNQSQSSQPAAQPAQTAQAQPPPPPPKPKPKKDKRPIEDRLVVGMTMDDVKAACGNPKNVAMNSDGSATWIYDNSQNAFIPYYMDTGHKIHHVTIFFDNNGKVKSWSATDTSMY
jgi:SmpA / OmlA family